jgi:ribosome modulation factor
VAEQLRIQPDLTLGKVEEQNAYADPDYRERWLDGLRRAGLPE